MVAWPVLGVGTSLLLAAHKVVAIPVIFGEMLALAWYAMSIRCPSCGKPVGYDDGWSALAPSICRNCGRDLKL
jgi:hypothetical protein